MRMWLAMLLTFGLVYVAVAEDGDVTTAEPDADAEVVNEEAEGEPDDGHDDDEADSEGEPDGGDAEGEPDGEPEGEDDGDDDDDDDDSGSSMAVASVSLVTLAVTRLVL